MNVSTIEHLTGTTNASENQETTFNIIIAMVASMIKFWTKENQGIITMAIKRE